MDQKFIDEAKRYWREKGYAQGAVMSIAEHLERIERIMLVNEDRLDEIAELNDKILRLEVRADNLQWESEMKEWK